MGVAAAVEKETPEAAARRLAQPMLSKGFHAEALHTYTDAAGAPLYWRLRLRHPDSGAKWIRPMRLNGAGFEFGEPSFPAAKPLYRLHEIAADTSAPVYVVEGEKAADVLAALGVLATTSGAADSAGRADWTPLRGRDCVVWPDRDAPGIGYATAAAAALWEAEARSVQLVDIEALGLPEKGDAADWRADNPHATDENVFALPTRPAPEPMGRLQVVDIHKFLAIEFPPRVNLLNPWLPRGGIALVHAWRGLGKTHVSAGTAYAIASGGRFLRWEAPAPVGVLFVDGEMPAPVLQERFARIAEAAEKEPGAPLRIITPDLQTGGMPDLSAEAGQAAIDRYVTDDIGVLVLDNLSTLCRGGVENEAESWIPVQAWCLRHRARGRSVVLIHHSGKGGAQRGTSKREDVLDTVIRLSRPEGYQPQEGARFLVEFEKARGCFGKDVESFVATLATDQRGRQAWQMETLEESTYERCIELAKEGLSLAEIAKEIGRDKSTVSRHLKRAKKEGRT